MEITIKGVTIEEARAVLSGIHAEMVMDGDTATIELPGGNVVYQLSDDDAVSCKCRYPEVVDYNNPKPGESGKSCLICGYKIEPERFRKGKT